MKNVNTMGPESFLFTTKEGLKMYYSYTVAKTKGSQQYYYSWFLQKVEDLYGNYYEYIYNIDQGEEYLSSILYTKNISQGLTHYNTINFHYSRRKDKSQFYDAGMAFSQSLLLDRIEITGEAATAFKKYSFKYGYNGTFSQLKEISEQGSDGSELNSTIFKYGNAVEVLTNSTADVALNQYKDIYYGDFDGDGVTDMLTHYFTNNSGQFTYTGFAIWKRTSANSSWIQSSPVINTPGNYEFNKQPFNVNSFVANDFNGDGRTDILLVKTSINAAGKKVVDLFKIFYPNEDASNFTEEIIYPPLVSTENFNISGNTQGYNFFTVGDFDGDGKSDFFAVLSNNIGFKNFYIRPNTSTVITQCKSIYSGNANYDGMDIANQDGKFYAVEVNADGKSELMVVENSQTKVYEIIKNPNNFIQPWQLKLLITDGYPTKWHDIVQFGDFNGDGKTDMITKVQSSGYKEIAICNGDKWIGTPLYLEANWVNGSRLAIGDFNGDGRSDYAHLYPNWSGGVSNSTTFDIYISKGLGVERETYGNVSWTNSLTPTVIGDFNGDGKSDLLLRDSWSNPLRIFSLGSETNNQLLQKTKNGHGLVNEFGYQRLNSGGSIYTKSKVSTFPLNVLTAPLWCVNQYKSSDGIGGQNIITYSYENLIYHRAGKGMLGFENTTTINPVLNSKLVQEFVVDNTNFQLYPKANKIYRYDNSQLLNETTSIYQILAIGNGRYRQRLLRNSEKDLQMNVIKLTSFNYDSYENTSQIIETVTDPNTQNIYPPVDPFYRTISTFSSYIVSGGLVPTLPSSITVQKQRFRNGTGITSITTSVLYNNKGQIIAQTEFAGLPKAVTSNYSYNGVGKLNSKSINAAGMLAKLTNYEYDNKYRFVITKSNLCPTCPGAAVLTETFNYSPLWGTLLYQKDAQCQQFFFTYDAFGRAKTETDNYGITTTSAYSFIAGGGNNKIFRTIVSTPSRPYNISEHDIMSRVVAQFTQSKDGQQIRAFTAFNNKGQKISETNGHFTNETPLYTYFSYDALNRLNQIQNVQGVTNSTYSYPANEFALQTTVTLPDGREKIQVTEPTGAIQSAEDNGGKLTYKYNANDDIALTQKDGITVLSNNYDAYHRLSQTTDPNTGTINFEYNAYGDLYRQTDNLGNVVEKHYDGFGRISSVISPEGTTQYGYGVHYVYIPSPIVSPGLPNTGQYCLTQVLKKITGFNGIEQSFFYDDKIQVTGKYETIDGQTYNTSYDYTSSGELSQIYYPSGVSILNIYNNLGFLVEKKDQNNNSLFNLLQVNGMGQPTQFKLGNNPNSSVTYNNGFPQQYATLGIQNLSFSFNQSSGNLTSRKDAIKGREETFTYDILNRLKSSQLLGQALVEYYYDPPSSQSLGNFEMKQDVGEYGYTSNKINAVTKVQNLSNSTLPPENISTITQKITYSPQQRPSKMEEGEYIYGLVYSPQNERIKTIKKFRGNVEETKFYFEDCEKIVNATGTKWVTYVNGANGLAAIIVTQNGDHENHFTYTDHLGSILTVTDASGNIEAEQNFDAWGGKRQPNTWTPISPQSPNSFDWLARGFTGHEHLPEFALINMNARLYDPVVGRMLSPDNYIMGETNTQGYNRYTYALNNPLVYTDPSGEWLAPIWFGMSLITNYASNLIYGEHGAFKSALKSSNELVGNLGNVGRVTLGSGEHHRWSAGLDLLGLGVSIRYDYFNGNFSANASLGLYVSPMGAGPGASAGIGYQFGEFVNLGLGIGTNFSSFSASANISLYNEKLGLGVNYSYNYYSGADAQTTGTIGIRYKNLSIAMENDFAAFSGDKWRTGAFTLGYKDYFVRTNIYTNDGKNESVEKLYFKLSPIWHKNSKEGAWSNGQVIRSSLSFGYRYGGSGSSWGFSWKGVQDFLQNGIHRHLIPTPYYLDYSRMDKGYYYNSGPRNMYSAW